MWAVPVVLNTGFGDMAAIVYDVVDEYLSSSCFSPELRFIYPKSFVGSSFVVFLDGDLVRRNVSDHPDMLFGHEI
jgi:hypothetical protein